MNHGNYYINKYTIQALKLSPYSRCLEVGMGNGRFIESIFQTYGDSIFYFGLDHSKDMVREARALNSQRVADGRVMIRNGRVEEMLDQGDPFDVVFSVNTIYFWEDVHQTIEKVKDVLISKGRLILAIRPKSLMETYPMVKHGFKMFEDHELVKLLEDAGFEKVTIESKEEPPQEVYGQKLSKSTLIFSAEKP